NLPPNVKKVNYHGYVVNVNNASHGFESGFCILDPTLAVAGPLPGVEAALDQYKSGKQEKVGALLDRARTIPENYQVWGGSVGVSTFITDNAPPAANGLDIGRIFRSLQNTVFEFDLRSGLKGLAEGNCTTP